MVVFLSDKKGRNHAVGIVKGRMALGVAHGPMVGRHGVARRSVFLAI